MKTSHLVLIVVFFCIGFFGFIGIKSLIVNDPKPDDCVVKSTTITEVSEGTSNDIVFTDTAGDHYYINRGLERELNLDSLNAKVLNKTVTLHLPKVLMSLATSEHIAQLAIDDQVIFTEFE